jgi:translocation and assembly module TamB
MTAVPAQTDPDSLKKKPRFKWAQAIMGTLLLVSVLWLGLYLRSDAFRDLVRRKVIAELELVTGGKVEIQSFNWTLSKLQFEAAGVTIHGLENGDQAPFIHADRIAGQGKIISLFGRQIGLRSLTIDHPVIHFIIYPDGSTNQPMPKIKEQDTSPIQPLFDMAISRMEINNAELLLNEKKIPFDFSGEGLSGGMNYIASSKDYEGNFTIKVVAAHYPYIEPLHGILELHFFLRPTQVEIKTLKFTVNHSVLEANGTVTNYANPEVHAQYSASLDLAEMGRSIRIHELQAGRVALAGVGSYRNGRYATQGTLTGQNVGWRTLAWNVAGIDFTSPFLIIPERISLSRLNGKAFGGSAQGEVEVANWNAPPSKKKDQQRGAANLRLQNMQAGELAAVISSSRLPLHKINLVGAVSGTVSSTWIGSPRNSVTDLKLDATPPHNPAPKQLPVTGSLQATYRAETETLDVAGLSFASRGIRLNATGTLGSSSGQLKIAFNANDLHELQPVLAAWSPGTQVPLEVHGRASFNGTLFGRMTAISARGRLDFQDFDTLLDVGRAGVAHNGARRMHWDSVVADILLTPSSLSAQNGVLKRGAAQATFSGSATLNKGQFDPASSEVNANVQLQNANLEDARSLIGFDYPVTGNLNADLRVRGTPRALRGSGTVEARKLTIYGEPFSSFRSSINFAGPETQFNNMVLSHNGGRLTGAAAFNTAARSFRFDVTGADIELANFRRFEPQRFSMAGRAEFHATGSGTLDSPVINAQLTMHGLVVNGELVGDVNASAETRGENMAVRAKSNFENASFTLDGNVRLRENFPGQMTIKFEHLDFDPLIRAYLTTAITGHSSAEGAIEIHGPLKTPRALSVTASISQLSANIENVRIHNDGPLRFSVNNMAVHVDQFHLLGDEMDLALLGDMNLGGTQGLGLSANGTFDLKLMQRFNPNITSYGKATLAAHLGGTISQPQLSGSMDIANGGLSAVDLPNGLTQINGKLIFAQDRMLIQALRAHSGGGDLDLGGFISLRRGLYFDVTATGNDVRVRYPPGLSASANASFRYTGSAQSSLLSGNVTIVRLAVDPRFDFAQYLARAKNPVRTGIQNPFLENLRLDVHIVSTPELQVETSLAKVSGDADLRIRGTFANPAVLGRVNIAEGYVSFNGTRYRLERGDVTFTNPQIIQPIVNVEMAARVRDYDITIGFHGPVDRLNITYRSDPPLPSGDIIALLAFGRTKEEDIYSNQTTTTLTTSDAMLQQALTTASSSRVQKLFGVGSVKIDPQGIGTESNLGPRVTIEQQIQNNITLTYITNLAQSSSEQVIQVEYNLTKSISVVAVRDQNGILGFEVRIRKRKR